MLHSFLLLKTIPFSGVQGIHFSPFVSCFSFLAVLSMDINICIQVFVGIHFICGIAGSYGNSTF